MSRLRWAWSRVQARGWWVSEEPRARILAEGGVAVAELPGLASRLLALDDEQLLALGEDRVWICSLRDGALEERTLPAGLHVDADLAGLGGRRIAWVGPGDHAVRMLDLDTDIGLQLWPLEGRVAHHRPRLAVDDDRRTLVWCHVTASIDRFELEHGGYPRALASPPAPAGPVTASVFPAELAELLVVLDDGDVGVVRGIDGGWEIRRLAGDGGGLRDCWTLTTFARPLDFANGRALLLGDHDVELWTLDAGQPATARGRCAAAGAVSGRLLDDGRALLGDARGRAWIATPEDSCRPS